MRAQSSCMVHRTEAEGIGAKRWVPGRVIDVADAAFRNSRHTRKFEAGEPSFLSVFTDTGYCVLYS